MILWLLFADDNKFESEELRGKKYARKKEQGPKTNLLNFIEFYKYKVTRSNNSMPKESVHLELQQILFFELYLISW